MYPYHEPTLYTGVLSVAGLFVLALANNTNFVPARYTGLRVASLLAANAIIFIPIIVVMVGMGITPVQFWSQTVSWLDYLPYYTSVIALANWSVVISVILSIVLIVRIRLVARRQSQILRKSALV